MTLHELRDRILTASELRDVREHDGLNIQVTLTVDAEAVFESLSSVDLKVHAEKTLLVHVAWLRELMVKSILKNIQWCDTRDQTSDGHTKGSVGRHLPLTAMAGRQEFKHAVKAYEPYRKNSNFLTLLCDLD